MIIKKDGTPFLLAFPLAWLVLLMKTFGFLLSKAKSCLRRIQELMKNNGNMTNKMFLFATVVILNRMFN